MSRIWFKDEGHEYGTEGVAAPVKWTSVTSLIKQFIEPFDGPESAMSSSINPNSRWHGMDPEEIQNIWKTMGDEAAKNGTWYHNKKEKAAYDSGFMVREGNRIKVFNPIYEGDKKIALPQQLETGIYPEHIVYSNSHHIIGQTDRADVYGNKVHINDYKSNREIKKRGFFNVKDRTYKTMLFPLHHLEDCDLTKFGLQLSTYMYLILKHNPSLVPGEIFIQHIKFKTKGKDKFGYPLLVREENGDPILDEVVPYKLPYYKREVELMLKYKK